MVDWSLVELFKKDFNDFLAILHEGSAQCMQEMYMSSSETIQLIVHKIGVVHKI